MNEFLVDKLRRVRWYVRSALGKSVYYTPQIHIHTAVIGGSTASSSGAWTVATELLNPDSIIYSVGVGEDISFDAELIRKCGVTVHAFDPTPSSQEWLQDQSVPSSFILHPIGVAHYDGIASFHAHIDPRWTSRTVGKYSHTVEESIQLPVRRLLSLMKKLEHEHIDLLKLDIEGGEYDVIDDIITSKIPVSQLLVEFHHSFKDISPERTRRSIEQLIDANFQICHVSPNGEEYSFVKVD